MDTATRGVLDEERLLEFVESRVSDLANYPPFLSLTVAEFLEAGCASTNSKDLVLQNFGGCISFGLAVP